MRNGDAPRVLVLISADFGELANAVTLLEGTQARALLLLPTQLFDINPTLLPHEVMAYRTSDDVVEALSNVRPHYLLLMSAYLFEINRLLSHAELSRILTTAKSMGASVATTDPFLGVDPSPVGSRFSTHGAAPANHMASLRKQLRDVPHVYLSPTPARSENASTPVICSFFNPRVILSPEARVQALKYLQQGSLQIDSPYWLFVLSGVDYRLQCGVHGKPRFDEILATLLFDATAAGRIGIILAPPDATAYLANRADERIRILPFCDYPTFQTLLISAEHVFYWNALSNSLLIRGANAGSFHFFDTGHLTRYIPEIFPLALASYYANASLPMLDPSQRLDQDALNLSASQQLATFSPAMHALKSLPSPEALLATLK